MESISRVHDVPFDNIPAFFEKKTRKAIRSGRLISRHLIYGTPEFGFCKVIGEHVKIMRRNLQSPPI